jgi:HlyD family secretion protein
VKVGGVVLYKVTIDFDVPENLGIIPGMSASADIILNERSNVLLVPDRAITQNSQGNPMVKVVLVGGFEDRMVVTGLSDGFETEIVQGLKEGEVVIVGS